MHMPTPKDFHRIFINDETVYAEWPTQMIDGWQPIQDGHQHMLKNPKVGVMSITQIRRK